MPQLPKEEFHAAPDIPLLPRDKKNIEQLEDWKEGIDFNGSPLGLAAYDSLVACLTLDAEERVYEVNGAVPEWALRALRPDQKTATYKGAKAPLRIPIDRIVELEKVWEKIGFAGHASESRFYWLLSLIENEAGPVRLPQLPAQPQPEIWSPRTPEIANPYPKDLPLNAVDLHYAANHISKTADAEKQLRYFGLHVVTQKMLKELNVYKPEDEAGGLTLEETQTREAQAFGKLIELINDVDKLNQLINWSFKEPTMPEYEFIVGFLGPLSEPRSATRALISRVNLFGSVSLNGREKRGRGR